MTIPSGVQKTLIIGKQSAKGTLASTGSGKKMRRVDAQINLTKNAFESNEIRSDAQTVDSRHGMRKVEGTINGEVSCLTYQAEIEAVLRAAFAAGATTGALTTLSVVASSNQFHRSSGSFVSDGFMIGDLVLVSGFATSGNDGQFIVTAVTASDLTVDPGSSTLVDEAAGPSVTIAVDGKKCQVPSTGHTKDYFTIEQFYEMGTTDVSELAQDCLFTSMDLDIQPNGMSKISFGVMGLDMTSDNTAYFVSPTAETTTAVMAGPQGAIYIDGMLAATITALQCKIDGNAQTGEVIGSTTSPDVFTGRVIAQGQFTAYFLDNDLWTKFRNETEGFIVMRLSGGTDQSFVIKLPRVKYNGASKDDKEVGGLIQTVPFRAIKYVGTGQRESSTVVIQDTEAV